MQKRNEKKANSERRYYDDKAYVSGDWLCQIPTISEVLHGKDEYLGHFACMRSVFYDYSTSLQGCIKETSNVWRFFKDVAIFHDLDIMTILSVPLDIWC